MKTSHCTSRTRRADAARHAGLLSASLSAFDRSGLSACAFARQHCIH